MLATIAEALINSVIADLPVCLLSIPGRKVKNEFESDGDLTRIFGTANATATERTYATSFSYSPDGRIERLRLGNGLWEKAVFNSRLQVTELNVGRGLYGDQWKLGYEYGELNADGTTVETKDLPSGCSGSSNRRINIRTCPVPSASYFSIL